MGLPRADIVQIDLLNDKLQRYSRGNLLGTGDGYADRFGVEVFRGGKAADLSEYTVNGFFIRPDGTTITIEGAIEGSKAVVVLTSACYYYDGNYQLTIKLLSSGAYKHTLAIFDGTIAQTSTDRVIDSANAFSPADAVLRRINYNLLDNSDFTQPINQRGKTNYNGQGYAIDRWFLANANSSLTVGNKYILLKASGGAARVRQYIMPNAGMYGKSYTAAVCTNGGFVTAVSGVLTEGAVTSETTFASATVADGVTLRLTKLESGLISIRIDITDGNSTAFRWAALYEGSYTKDNLPPYQYKGYAAELLECQRYFRRTRAESTYATIGVGMARTATNAWINVPRSSRMRLGKPTVTVTGSLRLYAGASAVESTAITVDKISDSFIRLNVTASGLSVGAAIVATTGDTNEFHIDEDANL